jgi:excisionase family DNA binding protein
MQILLKVRDVAARLNVVEKTVYRKITGGKLKVVRLGRSIRISEEALNEYLNTNQGMRACHD